jgi:hypothetical protein
MTTRTKAGPADLQSGGSPAARAKRPVGKRPAKAVRNPRKAASASLAAKVKQSAAKKSDQRSGIREAEEARALLEDQLHSLYWWVFNAFKMKGFIRAKALEELQRSTAADGESHSERDDFADADVSPEKQTP